MGYSINLGNWNCVFAVPSCVVDKHIKLAGSAQLKVLLWTLRHAGEPFEIEALSKALAMHPADAKDAMQYWIESGLLKSDGESYVPSNAEDLQKTSVSAEKDTVSSKKNTQEPPEEAPKKAVPVRPRPLSRPQKPDPQFVAKRISDQPELSFLMQEAQIILGRPISNGDCATLLMLHDNDGLPVDVIIMILQYAVSAGKSNMKYIEKVAVSWAAEEIDTIEKAENKIRALDEHKRAWKRVVTILGLESRSPTSKEDECSNRWINEWKFSDEMIREAYERCVDAKGKYISKYIDSILLRWHNSNICTIEQALEEKRTSRSKKLESQAHSPSYDIDEYENASIFDDLD